MKIIQADWKLEDCKGFRNPNLHVYKLAVKDMKIFDGIAREIPEVIFLFKPVYAQKKLLQMQEI